VNKISNSSSRKDLRQQLRRQRRSLSFDQQQLASLLLKTNINAAGLLRGHQHIAFYLSNDGEIDPYPLILQAHKQGSHCYLPVLAPGGKLWFVLYKPGDKLKNNRFGIPEPANKRRRRKAWSLGVVLLPLVGFDRQGGRLGMGGGFYDQSFKNKRLIPAMKQPQLIGLAHHCQELESLTMESWDIPLSQIVTDRDVISVK
jgi:5-formyltetrahydrofolate cyclo-ligase